MSKWTWSPSTPSISQSLPGIQSSCLGNLAPYPKLRQLRAWSALSKAAFPYIMQPFCYSSPFGSLVYLYLPSLLVWFSPLSFLLFSRGSAQGHVRSELSQTSLTLAMLSLLSRVNHHLHHTEEKLCPFLFFIIF